jgi:hypothetical protein
VLGPLKEISFVRKKGKRGVKEFFIGENLYFILDHPVNNAETNANFKFRIGDCVKKFGNHYNPEPTQISQKFLKILFFPRVFQNFADVFQNFMDQKTYAMTYFFLFITKPF